MTYHPQRFNAKPEPWQRDNFVRTSRYRDEEIRETRDHHGVKRYSWRGSNWAKCSKALVCDAIDQFKDCDEDWPCCEWCGDPIDPDEVVYAFDDAAYPCHDGGCDAEFIEDWRS